MPSISWLQRVLCMCAIWLAWSARHVDAASACVWKVTGPQGDTLYLGGSIHALRSTDYPLPAAYNRAFDSCNRVLFEVDERALIASSKDLEKSAQYSKRDSLKNHVDPRTYDYLRRVFARLKVSEEKWARYRPWFLMLALDSPGLHGLSENLGVEKFLEKRAKANRKPVSGLESAREHSAIFSGLTDRESEALLLLTFIPRASETDENKNAMNAWRHGDANALARLTRDSFRDFPAFGERLLGARNRNWIPKIESALRSGNVYFVVAGAAHMGGPDGVPALLRDRGYQIEQL